VSQLTGGTIMKSVYDRCRIYRLPLLLLGALAPAVGWCADNGIYIGGSLASPSPNLDWSTDHGPEDEGEGLKAIVGARPLDWLAIEANYVDLGETAVPLFVACPAIAGFPCPDEETFDARAVSISVLGMLALPLVDLYARAGSARWETKRQVRFGPVQKRAGTDATYGLGLQARVGSFALRAEYERFDFDRDEADSLSVGFTYTFL
jgi:hypothetical protein